MSWRRGNLELSWYEGDSFANARGLVWSKEPIYLAAAVSARDGNCHISYSGLHGMSSEDETSLREYLDFMRMTKQCICIVPLSKLLA